MKFIPVYSQNNKEINLDALNAYNFCIFCIKKIAVSLVSIPVALFKPSAVFFNISELIKLRKLHSHRLWLKEMKHTDSPCVIELKNVYIEDNLVVFNNNKIFRNLLQTRNDLSGMLRPYLSKKLKRVYFLLPKKMIDECFLKQVFKDKKIIEINEEVITFTNFHCNNYTHFLVEMFPVLYFLKDRIKDKKIILNTSVKTKDVNYDKMSYIMPILKSFGIKEDQIIFVQPNCILKCQKLISATGVQFNKKIHNEAFDYLIKQNESEFRTTLGERLYFARKSTFRKISNEADVRQELEKHGFVEVEMEKYDIVQQMSIMKNAKIIAGITSTAIFGNLSFAHNPITVIEFRHNSTVTYPISCTNLIKQPLRQFFIFCKKTKFFKSWHKGNLIVDVKKLQCLINKIKIYEN